MTPPFFYFPDYPADIKLLKLDEPTSAHIVQVLRMKQGESIQLTDGKGMLLKCVIEEAHKKHCIVAVDSTREFPGSEKKICIAISLIKNSARFEWFLEKATEIGVSEIIPLVCERTEKERFRFDRMNAICISAMLQSQQCWLPVLHEPQKFQNLGMWKCENGGNFIAHCVDSSKELLSHLQITTFPNALVCVGPEGDFTEKEIQLALGYEFIPVSLGATRLRTETAGIVAAVWLKTS